MKLWRWNLDFTRDSKMLEEPKSRRGTHREWDWSRDISVISQQSWKERITKLFDIRHGATGFGACPARFQSCFSVSPAVPLSLPFRVLMHILCHCMLEVWYLHRVILQGVTIKEIALGLRRDFGLLNYIKTEILWDVCSCTWYILHYDIDTSLWGPGSEMWWLECEWPPEAHMFCLFGPQLGEMLRKD